MKLIFKGLTSLLSITNSSTFTRISFISTYDFSHQSLTLTNDPKAIYYAYIGYLKIESSVFKENAF